MKKLGGKKMKKLVLLVVVLLMAQLSYGWPSVTYTCGFEPNEQGTSFATGGLAGQGTPAWAWGYNSAYDKGGSVINIDVYSGNQSAVVSGYQSSWLDLGAKYVPEWIEFAFKPQFAPLNKDGSNYQIAKVMTTRGPYYDIFGIYMYMSSADGNIQIWDLATGGFKAIGKYVNNEWQTISFRQETFEYPEESGNMFYNGYFDVYLGKDKVASHIATVPDYNCIQTMIFMTSETTWTHGGAIGIDGINVGDTYMYASEPATMGLLAMGLCSVIRRKRA
jgi:hypothetical protein